MKKLIKRIFQKEDLNDRLRRAVQQRKARQVALLLDQGASPTWMCSSVEKKDQNALLLACKSGDTEILNLLLDSFFQDPNLLAAWGRQMYCVVIRNGHWRAFQRLQQRQVPMQPNANGNMSSSLPVPSFVAAEFGQHQILYYLIHKDRTDWRRYEFHGHSLLSIASRNGHYECVEVLLQARQFPPELLQFPIECARLHRQAHILVLLTSCLPEFQLPRSDPEPFSPLYASGGKEHDRHRFAEHRGSLAETEVMSEYGRRSSLWLPGDESDEDENYSNQLYDDLMNYPRSSDYAPSSDYPPSSSYPPSSGYPPSSNGPPLSNYPASSSCPPSSRSQPPLSMTPEDRRGDPTMRTIDGFAIIDSAKGGHKKNVQRLETMSSNEDFENSSARSFNPSFISAGHVSPPPTSASASSDDLMFGYDEIIYPFEINSMERRQQEQKQRERVFQLVAPPVDSEPSSQSSNGDIAPPSTLSNQSEASLGTPPSSEDIGTPPDTAQEPVSDDELVTPPLSQEAPPTSSTSSSKTEVEVERITVTSSIPKSAVKGKLINIRSNSLLTFGALPSIEEHPEGRDESEKDD
ncbi:TPA: hypothetical protein N0F65_008829 [Lagenidium giganteum]|uniref:Uncharacterized protein n=1 Tax=Lagenidium giganteum TaxID=4803 RepID=A0AAV2YU23_9STRA|nr:TPA: hypothetical protein N0F65_008829 [Lagenidium giganteum]